MKNKLMILSLLVANFSLLTINNDTRFTKALEGYEEFAILKDGVWLEDATTAPTTGASAAIADGIVTSTGDWTMDRVLFGKTIDLSSYEFVEFTYTSTNVTGGNIGFANTLDWGEYHSAHSGWLTFSTTGENNTLRLNISDFVLKDQDACSWGSCEKLSTLDLTSIGGFDIKHGAGNITISEIIAYKSTGGSSGGDGDFDDTAVTMDLFNAPLYVSEVTKNAGGAPTISYGTDSTNLSGSLFAGGEDNNAVTLAANGDTTNGYTLSVDEATTIRFDNAAPLDLTSAMLNDAVITFKATFDVEDGTDVKFRLYDGQGSYGERYCSEMPLETENTSKVYSIKLADVSKIATTTSWGSAVESVLDLKQFQGIGFALSKPGSVTFDNVSIKYTPVNRTLTGIEAQVSKTEYLTGQDFELKTLTVNALFDDESKANNISNYKVSELKNISATNNTLTVSYVYEGNIYSTTVELVAASVDSISIVTQPTKLTYVEGEEVDLNGIVVNALAGSSTIENVPVTCDKDIVVAGDDKLILSYAGATVELPITVRPLDNAFGMFNETFFTEIDGELYTKDGYYQNNGIIALDGDKITLVHEQTNGWKNTRFMYANGSPLNVQNAGTNGENVAIYITYKAESPISDAAFMLFNPVTTSTWDHAYTKTPFAVIGDGKTHIAKINLADLYHTYDGHLDDGTACPTTNLLLDQISGFGVVGTGKIVISNIDIKWDGDVKIADVKWEDKVAPQLLYLGEKTLNYTEGDVAPTFNDVLAYDIIDGNVNVEKIWSAGAIDENGNLTVGTHTVILRAKDAAGNTTNDADYTITIVVESKDPVNPPVDQPSDQISDQPSENVSTPTDVPSDNTSDVVDLPVKKGCKGSATTSTLAILVVGLAMLIKNKKNK